MKRCNRCGEEKDEGDFYIDSRSKKTPKATMPGCKACVQSANRKWAEQNPKKVAARSRIWRRDHPGRASAISRAWQLRHPEQFKAQIYRGRFNIDFEAVWQAQNGLCALCGGPMLREGKLPTSVCADHDRACCSGKKSCGKCVRGLIHRNCNLVLGYAQDNPDLLQKAVAYLVQWQARFSVRAQPREEAHP